MAMMSERLANMPGTNKVVTPRIQLENAHVATLLLQGSKIEGFEPECAQYPEAFFPDTEDHAGRAQAKMACGRCPIRMACLEAAMVMEASRATSGRWGVWGGLDEGERESLARKRRRALKEEP